MSEKTLKFNNFTVNKKEFHKSNLPIDLSLVTLDQIVVSDKFKHSDEGFKYFIGYQEDGKIKTNVLGNRIRENMHYKGNMHYICITCITIDSVMRADKKKVICKFI